MNKTDNTANQQSPANQQSSKLHPDVKNYVKLFFKENKLVAFLSMIVFYFLVHDLHCYFLDFANYFRLYGR